MGVARTVAVLGRGSDAESDRSVRHIELADARASARLSVRGLVLDMAGVLYDATLWRRSLVRLLSHLGLDVSYRSFFCAWDREYLIDVHRGRREYGEAFQAFLLAQGLTWAQIDEVEAASRIGQLQLEAGERPLPGVAETLPRLVERGLSLAVLADSPLPAARLTEQLERLGLGGLFEAVVSSCDIEAVKPDAASYRAAVASLDLEPRQAAFVGHAASDLAGATAAGLQTIAFNHDSDAQADAYLTRFSDLLAVVALA